MCCLYFNKTGGKNKPPGGIITYEKKNVIHAVYEYIDIPVSYTHLDVYKRQSNVSGSYLSENKTGTTPGIPLNMGDSKVLFGYIVHKGEKINESVQELIDFLVARLHKS